MERSKLHDRNFGFWNEEEQKLISDAQISIAGVGGDGFQLGYKLAMMGVKRFSIADPETFEEENANRVFGANKTTYGHKKAEVFKNLVENLHDDAQVTLYEEGVNADNVGDFLDGSDLVLDESELTHLELGTMIGREAAKQHIPDLFVCNLGFAAVATTFRADGKLTFEDMMGIPKNESLDEIAKRKVDLSRCLPYIPKYGDMNTLETVNNGASLPSISQGVDIASAIGTTEVFFSITSKANNHRPNPTYFPKFRYIDSYNGESGIRRLPRLGFYAGLGRVVVRSALGLNPKASYTQADIDRRKKS